jgi:hypothetical protein
MILIHWPTGSHRQRRSTCPCAGLSTSLWRRVKEGVTVHIHAFVTSTLGREWSGSRSSHFNPRNELLVPIQLGADNESMPFGTFSTRKQTLAATRNKTQNLLLSAPCSPYIRLGFPIPAFHRPNNYIDLLKLPIPNCQQTLEHEGQITRKRS